MVEYEFSRAKLRDESDYINEIDIRATNPNEVHRKIVRSIQNLRYAIRNEGIKIQKGAIGESYGTIEGRIYADKVVELSAAGHIKFNPYQNFAISMLVIGIFLLFISIYMGQGWLLLGLIALLILVLGVLSFRHSREFDIPALLKSIFRILEEGEATKTSEETISNDKDIKTTRHYLRSNLSIIISCKSSLRINYKGIVNPMLKEKISNMSEGELKTLFDKHDTIDKLNSIKQKMKEEVSEISKGIQSFADL